VCMRRQSHSAEQSKRALAREKNSGELKLTY
jgi:hypothetical protein